MSDPEYLLSEWRDLAIESAKNEEKLQADLARLHAAYLKKTGHVGKLESDLARVTAERDELQRLYREWRDAHATISTSENGYREENARLREALERYTQFSRVRDALKKGASGE